MTRSAFFVDVTVESTRTRLTPGPSAASGWGSDHMRGMAISGALAREAERTLAGLGRGDLIPVRWSIDLFRPTRMAPIDVRASVVRNGRRLCVIDVTASQNGQGTARATAAFSAASEAGSQGWTFAEGPEAPESDGADHPDEVERIYWTERRGWLAPGSFVYTDDRKALWHFAIPVVGDEEPSSFVSAATVADVINAIASVGPDGLAFINPDATMHLSRLPEGAAVGLAMVTRTVHAGLSAASAMMFDRTGSFGLVCASGMARPPVELLQHRLPDSGHDDRHQMMNR